MKKFIAYYRVSTDKQGKSGLGLDAQKSAVEGFIRDGELVRSYTEIESGRNSQRPELAKAIKHARRTGATLVIAKLDRLARNVAFIATMMDSGLDFIAVDNPEATRLSLHILAAVAEHEAQAISDRTKAALAAARAAGTKLGSSRPGHWKGREHLRNTRQAQAVRAENLRQKAATHYEDILPKVAKLRAEGYSLDEVCTKLNDEGYTNSAGNPFTRFTLCKALKRANKAN